MCLQETRKKDSTHYVLDSGHLVILSGSGGPGSEWSGVGFVISPRMKSYIQNFLQFSDRLCSLKIKTKGGKFGLVCAYAPHNLKSIDDKLKFYEDLSRLMDRISVNGPKLVFGDFNARLGQRQPGEDDVLGDFCFGLEAFCKVDIPNRDLLLEWCRSFSMLVSNTFHEHPSDKLVTYHEPQVRPGDPISERGFSMLDILLVSATFKDQILDVFSDRRVGLASHHFPVTAILDARIPKTEPGIRKQRLNFATLAETDVQELLRNDLAENVAGCIAPTHIDGDWSGWCERVHRSINKVIPLKTQPPKKPWVSSETLVLIFEKRAARQSGNWEEE